MNVQLICVGKLKEKFWMEAAAEYQKRLGAFCSLTVTELPEEKLPAEPSQAQIDAALRKEAQAIAQRIPQGAWTVCLCIEGKAQSSEDLAGLLRRFETDSAKQLVFLIGGSFGLDEELKARCRTRLSMSPMTFPHHLARIMALEQIYRAFSINAGSRYHK